MVIVGNDMIYSFMLDWIPYFIFLDVLWRRMIKRTYVYIIQQANMYILT